MNKSNLKESLKKFRKRLDDKYVIEGEYSPDTSVGNADIAKSLFTRRIISDADVACPPITYGIAGGEAEIETGYQKVVKLMGNTVIVDGVIKSAKSAKLVSRGKNQFTDYDEFIDVVGGMEFHINSVGECEITEYASDKETIITEYYSDDNDHHTLNENTRYIKIHSLEPNLPHPNAMMYYTFGEVYDEEYEKPVVSELVLPNVELLSVGQKESLCDTLTSDGLVTRKIGTLNFNNKSGTAVTLFNYNNRKAIRIIIDDIVIPSTMNTPDVLLDGYEKVRWDVLLNGRYLPNGKYICIPFTGAGTECIYIIDDEANIDYDDQNSIDEYVHSLPTLVYLKKAVAFTYEQVEPFDGQLFVDNFGTLLFLDENGEEVEVEQPYQIDYKVSLVELVDSLYAKLNGDADEVTTKAELVEGDVVPAQAKETKNVAPYSRESGIHVDGAFKFQTSGGDAECGDLARIECIKGSTVRIVSVPLHILNDATSYDNDDFALRVLEFNDASGEPDDNTFTLHTAPITNPTNYYAVSFDAKVSQEMCVADEVEYDSGDFIKLFGQNISKRLTEEFNHFFVVVQGSQFSNFLKNTPNDNIYGTLTIDNGIIYDLTTMFGKGYEPRTESDFRKRVPYDVFEQKDIVISSNPMRLINRSYNAFDGEFLNYAVGQDGHNEGQFVGKATSMIRVLPDTIYGVVSNNGNSARNCDIFFFKDTEDTEPIIEKDHTIKPNDGVLIFRTKKDTQYVRLNVTNNITQLAVFVYWDGSKTELEPQKVWRYDFPSFYLAGIDEYRDEYYPDGKINRHVITIDRSELFYSTLNQLGRIVSNNQFYLTFEDIEHMVASRVFGASLNVDSIKDLRFIILGCTYEIVEEDGEEPYLLINTGDYGSDEWEANGSIDIEMSIASPNVIYVQNASAYASDITIDNWGTMEWVSRSPEANTYNLEIHCVINYVGDYVAFIDTLTNREDVQYDAHQLLTKSDESIAQFFDDKDFIINGKKMCSDPVRVLTSPVDSSIKPHRRLRNGNVRSFHAHDYIGKKKFNEISDYYFGDIETLIQDFYGVSDLVFNKLYSFFGEKNINHGEDGDVVFHGDTRLYGSFVYIAEVGWDDLVDNETYHPGGVEYYLDTSSKWFQEISNCGFPYSQLFMSEDDKRIKIHKVYKNRIFKFVRNFEYVNKTAGLGWKGIMANEGIEMEVYVMSDYSTDDVYLIFRPKKIILK